MAIASLNDFQTALRANDGDAFNSASVTTAAGRWASFYRAIAAPGQTAVPAIPTTAVALNNTDLGALNQQMISYSPSSLYIAGAKLTGSADGTFMLYDRLCHNGGLSGTVTGPQTTNLPTPTLPRYTDGIGVQIAIEFYTAVGTATSSITISYTNTDNVSGRNTAAMPIGSSGFGAGTGGAARFMILPLADGDKGVKSVESINITASTVTAGNLGVVLFKPISMFAMVSFGDSPYNVLTGNMVNIPEVLSTACLTMAGITGGTIALAGSLLKGVG
jgi:hypothetical protein